MLQARPKLAFMLVIAVVPVHRRLRGLDASTCSRLLLLFVAGFLNLAFSSMSQTLVQLHAPNAIRGRVLGLYSMCLQRHAGVFRRDRRHGAAA